MENASSKKRIIGCVVGVFVSLAIIIFFRPDGLDDQARFVLAFLAGAIVWWIFDVLPEFATSLLMAILFVVFAQIQPQTAFGFFSHTIWWLLIGAFAIGLGMKETGLLKRMALGIVSMFPPTFVSQVLGFLCCGFVIGPLIPSLAAKASLLAPLCMEVSDTLGYKRKGPQANGLFVAMYTGLQNITPLFISSSIMGYTLLALYPADIQEHFDFINWFLAALPWFIPMSILNFIFIVLLYRPKRKNTQEVSAQSKPAPTHDALVHKRRELGPMSKQEKQMTVIIVITVLLWITEGIHGFGAWLPALLALVVMVACGIVNKENIASGLNWGSLIFIGVVLSLGDVFTEAGLTTWIVATLTPLLTALASNIYLLLLGVAIITVLARFLIVAQTAYLNIFMVFTIPIALALGINPWVIGMACYATINVWFLKYQNPCYMAAYYSIDGAMVKQSEMAKYCTICILISIVSLMIAVPFWQGMGLC